MTQQRSLKRLVRERMERTGESYTTAHRIVTSRRPERREPGLLPSYPGAGFARHRESALVQRLLASAGLDLTEPMVCGLGGGIGFMYAVFEYKEVPHPLLTFVTQHHPRPWIEEVADNLGLEHLTQTSSAAAAALKKLDAAISGGIPVLLTVGRAGLPWHEGLSDLEAYDPYTIVVAGKDGANYLIDDCGENVERISADDLGTAWALHRKGRFAVQTLALPGNGARDITEAVHAAIATTAAHMTGPVIGNAFDVNFGLSGIEKWGSELNDGRTKKGWRTRFGAPQAFEHAMHRIVECFTVAYGSPGATRPIYADFLREAAVSTDPRFDAAAEAAAASGKLWEEVVAVALRAEAPEETFERIGDLAGRLLGAESRLVDLLAEAAAP